MRFQLVKGEGAVDGVLPHLFAAQGGEKGTAAERETEVASQRANVGSFAATYAEVDLRQLRRYGTLRRFVEVGARKVVRGVSCGQHRLFAVAGAEGRYLEALDGDGLGPDGGRWVVGTGILLSALSVDFNGTEHRRHL